MTGHEIRFWWKSITFDLSKFLDFITIVTASSGTQKINLAALMQNKSDINDIKNVLPENLSIGEISTHMGRCYLISLHEHILV